MPVHDNDTGASASVVSRVCGGAVGADLVQLKGYLTSVSQRSTNQIVQKFDIRNWIWLVKIFFLMATFTVLAQPVLHCKMAFTSIGKSSLALDRVTLALFDRSKKSQVHHSHANQPVRNFIRLYWSRQVSIGILKKHTVSERKWTRHGQTVKLQYLKQD